MAARAQPAVGREAGGQAARRQRPVEARKRRRPRHVTAAASQRTRVIGTWGLGGAAVFFAYLALTSSSLDERAIGAALWVISAPLAFDWATNRATATATGPLDAAVERLSPRGRVFNTLLFGAAMIFWGFCAVTVSASLGEHAFCLVMSACFAAGTWCAAVRGVLPDLDDD
jgi:hypothetical protein